MVKLQERWLDRDGMPFKSAKLILVMERSILAFWVALQRYSGGLFHRLREVREKGSGPELLLCHYWHA